MENEGHRMVRVLWIDSGMHVDHGWGTQQEYMEDANKDAMKVLTVGILMEQTGEVIAVALTHDTTRDMWYSAQLIARENVLDVQDLGPLV